MTTENLKKLYSRTIQFCDAKFGEKAEYLNRIYIDEYGKLEVEFLRSRGYCGDPDEYNYYTIIAEELSEDLNILMEQRKRKEEEEKERRRILEQQERERRAQVERENRKMTFLLLKKEFEP